MSGVFNQEEDWLDKVVREKGEQWQDPKVIAKGYVNAQEYIKQLEQQTAELKEDLGKKDYVEDLLKQLQQGQAKPPAGEPAVETNSGTGTDGNTSLEVSEETLKSLIDQTLTQRESQNTAAQNLAEAESKLGELYGTEAQKKVEERSKELGMSFDKLKAIAEESPSAFLELMGAPKKPSNPITSGTVNTDAASFNQPSTRDFQYYQKLRRENSKLYYSPKIQNQMLKDRMDMGEERFYN